MKIIECVPNFSEGQDETIINAISQAIGAVDGVSLLDVDPGKDTNRTVMTFVGAPEPVLEAAFQAIKKSSELIDMSKHHGEHPRFGATDVCPLIPISNVSMEECVVFARQLGKRVGEELGLSGYYYESAATSDERQNLAIVRSGEYEGLKKKLSNPGWAPDYGPTTFNPAYGVTAIGARDFLVAYNVNLNTTSVRRANAVAFDVREMGRVKREGDPVTGKIVRDAQGEAVREPGKLKAVKGIGWYIEEYGVAQISMNLTDIKITPLHIAFEACRESATQRGLRVTGSEMIGLVPKKVMLDAGKYFLSKQERSLGVSEEEIIHIAVKSMGLDELAPFDPKKKIIEYQLQNVEDADLVSKTLVGFADKTASESPAPGGGSVSSYVAALGASLGVMVANLSSHKRGWDDKWEFFSEWAERGQANKDELIRLVDLDTAAYNGIIAAIRLPKGSEQEKAMRSQAIQDATKHAINIPFRIMEVANDTYDMIEAMVQHGNPNSITDGAVGALCISAAVEGAYLNVLINTADVKDTSFVDKVKKDATKIFEDSNSRKASILAKVYEAI